MSDNRNQFIFWQIGQCLVLLFFLALIYKVEDNVVSLMMGGEKSTSLTNLENVLYARQWPFPFGKLWKTFPILLMIALCLFFFDRFRYYILGVLGGLVCALIIGDRIYFQFFTSLLSLQSVQVSQQAWAVKNSIISELRLTDMIPFLGMGFMVAFGYYFNKAMTPGIRKNLPCFITDRLLGVLFLFVAFRSGQNAFQIPLEAEARRAIAAETQRKIDLPDFVTSSVDYGLHFGILNYHINNFRDYLNAKSRPIDAAERQVLHETLSTSFYSNQTTSELEGIAKGMNVILVSMEAFQHYIIDLKVDGQELTPVLNELQNNALSWDYVIDNIARGGTSDAEFSALTGLLPNRNKITAMTMATNPPPISLPETLSAKGYHTMSMHGYIPSFWNRSVNHPALGIKEMLFQNDFKYTRKGIGVPDDTFFLQSADMLKKRPRPFFAFMISLSSHHPYTMPISDQKLNIDMPKSIAYDYFQSVHYADAALGLFLARLAEEHLLDQTLIVLYGDHAAPIDDANRQKIMRKTGIDPLIIRERRVPLIIYNRKLEEEFRAHKATYRKVVGGLQDVFPTVLHLLGKKIPFGIYGTHLFQTEDTRPVIPFYTHMPGFITRGVLYSKRVSGAFHDNMGVLYNPEYEPDVLNFDANFAKAYNVMLTHEIIFDKKPNFRMDWTPTPP